MRSKIGMALVWVIAPVVCWGLACTQGSKENPAPPGMVSVPAGEFIMGMSADDGFKECKKLYKDECKRDKFYDDAPVHRVYLDAYFIDRYEVTQEDYDKCTAEGKCQSIDKVEGFTEARQPVVEVTWEDARSYCSWAGKRLPTEAEWEKAARGTDGRMYPWGNEFDGKKANFCDKNCREGHALKDQDDGYSKTAPVGSYPAGASPFGVLDMAGNVWEWTADWYAEDYYKNSPARNPNGPDSGTYRVLRGGCWNNGAANMRTALRFDLTPTDRDGSTGFRCARN